ncbi:unnamed protein product [Leptosia nina]|uniref:RNA-binding protein 48 n=1 Tax=Leptosia nina TaxID=320188 RepID=A0AAV1JHI6_9NEOP
MSDNKQDDSEKVLLSHHQQQSLCTNRPPYRQGRKLTAVKAYSITKESNHLLIFGTPSLSLRQELKALFLKFGKLVQFNVSTTHAADEFTETYHAQYDKIQPARLAKRMLDTKNFYGGVLHVCYAPELESVEETRSKIFQRQNDVVFRLRNLQKDVTIKSKDIEADKITKETTIKVNMGEQNVICFNNAKKRKKKNDGSKRFKPPKLDKDQSLTPDNKIHFSNDVYDTRPIPNDVNDKICTIEVPPILTDNQHLNNKNGFRISMKDNIEIVDCTSVDKETITNINESLNYNKFGNEIVKKVPVKPINRIKFSFNKS